MWKEYEKEIYKTLKENYPESEIEYNDSIFGLYSKIDRQIDFSLRGHIAGKKVLGIVDCKFYNKKLHVKDIESFLGMMEDVNANFGLLITNEGYTPAAKNRVKYSSLNLDILNFNELGKIDISIDYFFNQNIKGQYLSKHEFYKRNKQNTGYFDKEKSDYKKRVLFYKEGFANTEYYAYKKILENSTRAFRDFSQLEEISLFIPSNINNKGTQYEDKKALFKCTISRIELESFLGLVIEDLRDDIKNWRKDFLSKLDKKKVMYFAEEYVTFEDYTNYSDLNKS
ncbi:restriction endonuclease [Tenacibaculum sp. Mcav3-52]|uniref:restriction endonuclease n=1 Tax=Tenacibaculum sp. Mcav3-52 TaxID=2917762 RepID=UPI001EF1FA11|nr:restriction endonuclease [Tenacibaculum sp. Mcav3-52]MCG7502181.1 restriction endonuclease [Tenacibaculum sp. Mcav3-52]